MSMIKDVIRDVLEDTCTCMTNVRIDQLIESRLFYKIVLRLPSL